MSHNIMEQTWHLTARSLHGIKCAIISNLTLGALHYWPSQHPHGMTDHVKRLEWIQLQNVLFGCKRIRQNRTLNVCCTWTSNTTVLGTSLGWHTKAQWISDSWSTYHNKRFLQQELGLFENVMLLVQYLWNFLVLHYPFPRNTCNDQRIATVWTLRLPSTCGE